MLGKKEKRLSMTEGPVFGKILAFAFPLIITNALQVLYNAADMIVVGRFSGVEGAVGAVGSTGAMINLIINLMFGFSVGANVVVANAIGASDEERCRRAVHSAMQVALVTGLVTMVIGVCFSRQLLVLMNADPALLELSAKYTRIYFLGLPFTALLNYAASILRAKGDTTTPMVVMSLSGLLNVVLNVVFVALLGMDVDGVAYATAISNAVSATVILVRMFRSDDWCRLEWRRFLQLHPHAIKRIVAIGLPAGLQGTLFSLSNVFIQSAVNGFGPNVITGNAIAANVEGLAYTATNSIYQAAITFTGQNIGARKPRRLGMIMRSCYFATFSIAVAVSGILMLLRRQVIMLYMAPDTANVEAVMEAALFRFGIVMPAYVLLAFMEVGSGVVRGMGKSLLSTAVSLVGSCLLRIVWIYTVFAMAPTMTVLLLVMPISWGLTASAHLVSSLMLRRRFIRRIDAEDAAAAAELPETASV